MPSEKSIQTSILQWLKGRAWTCKVILANKSGVPDILCVRDGVMYGIEVKTKNGKVSKLQEYQLSEIKKYGGNVAVARSLDDVKELFNE